MPVDAYGSSDGKDKEVNASEGRDYGGSRGQGVDRDKDDRRRRPESLPPPPPHGSSTYRDQSRSQGHSRGSTYDRERSEQYSSHGTEGRSEQMRGSRQQYSSRDRDWERDRERDSRGRPDYPSRDLSRDQGQRRSGGGDLREHLNQLRGKDGLSRDRESKSRSPSRSQSQQRLDQLNGGQTRTPPPDRPPAGTSRFLVDELRKAGQSLLVSRRTPELLPGQESPTRSGPPGSAVRGSGGRALPPRRMQDSRSPSDDDREAGEIPPEDSDGSRRKRRQPQSPSPAPKAARTATSGQGLLSRVYDDVQSFRQQQAELDIDPDAPALMKSSPSGSEAGDHEHELDVKYRTQLHAVRTKMDSDAEHSPGTGTRSAATGDDGEGGAHAAGVKSRWLVDADAAADSGAEQARGRRSSSRDASPSSSNDRSNQTDSLPPSPRSLMNKTYNMLQECRGVEEFEKISRISEGTYGVVYKAREKATGKLVALKMIKMEKEKEGFPVTSIREINVLLNFHHPNIVHVSEIVVNSGRHDQVFMVMELMDHDLRSIIEPAKGKEIRMSRPFSVGDIKNLMLQLLRGVSYLHNNWVLHRDLKTSNILYNSKGELKICDMGLARQYGSPLKAYTQMVVTLWYRAPELLFGTKIYSTAIDMWSVGCIMGELLLGTALLPGQGEFEQIDKIVNLLGTPSEDVWPGLKDLPNYGKIVLKQVPSQLRAKFQTSYGGGAMVTEAGFDLLSQMLAWDPAKRVSADEAMEHRWFKETPLPQKQELMPTFAPR